MTISEQIKKEKANWIRARKNKDKVAIKKAAVAMYNLEMKLKYGTKEENTGCK